MEQTIAQQLNVIAKQNTKEGCVKNVIGVNFGLELREVWIQLMVMV